MGNGGREVDQLVLYPGGGGGGNQQKKGAWNYYYILTYGESR